MDWDEFLRQRQNDYDRAFAALVEKYGLDSVQEAAASYGWSARPKDDEHDPLSNYRMPGRLPKPGGRVKTYSLQMLMDVEGFVRHGTIRTGSSVNAFCAQNFFTWVRGGDLATLCIIRGATLRRIYYRAVKLMNEQNMVFQNTVGRPPDERLGSHVRDIRGARKVSEVEHVARLETWWRSSPAMASRQCHNGPSRDYCAGAGIGRMLDTFQPLGVLTST